MRRCEVGCVWWTYRRLMPCDLSQERERVLEGMREGVRGDERRCERGWRGC